MKILYDHRIILEENNYFNMRLTSQFNSINIIFSDILLK